MKNLLTTIACGCAMLVTACKTETPEVLEISDAYAYAPLTDDGPAVAYFTLTNHLAESIPVHGFSSNCFAQAELHRSTIENGINRMESVTDLDVAPGSSVRLSPAGMHLMLMGPGPDVSPGSRCDVQIHYGQEQVMTLGIELLDRSQYRPAEPVK